MSAEANNDKTVIAGTAATQSAEPQAAPADGDESVTRVVAGAAPPSLATPPAQAAETGGVLPVGTRLGEFEITGLVGQGGFGIVYLAWDHSLERRVALKEYMPSALATRGSGNRITVLSARHQETFEAGMRSFINEAKLLAQFDHPSLVKVYRFWEDNGTAYMVMPYYEGVTLKQALKQMASPPDEAWLRAMLDPVSEALAVIHRENCFHRDVAPDNIMLLKDSGRPVLLDFGAARRVIGDMTQALTVILKPGYAPIEQYAEEPHLKQGAWTDIYALAAVLYFAILGKTPPPSVGRMMQDNYVPLTQSAAGRYGEAFLAAIDRSLAVKPDDRPQSIAEMRDLFGLAGGVPAAPRPLPSSRAATQVAPTSGGRRGLAIAGVVLALAAAGGALYALFGRGPAPTAPPAPAAAPTAIAAPTSAPVPQTPYDPARELEKIAAAATPGFTVTATVDQPRVRIGQDELRFRLRTSKAGYVYVFMVSTDGQFSLLFPNLIDRHNRIAAGQELALPRPAWMMTAGGPKGADRFVAMVSASPRDFSAVGFQQDSVFGEFPRAIAETVSHTDEPAPFAGKAKCDAPGPCPADYGAALFAVEEVESNSAAGAGK